MISANRIAGQMSRRAREKLERLADEIRRKYENRELQCQTVPMERRGRRIRSQPNTALISYAAHRAIVVRQLTEMAQLAVEHPRFKPDEFSQAIEAVNDYLFKDQMDQIS